MSSIKGNRYINIKGKRFGKLIVIDEIKKDDDYYYAICKCNCGNKHVVKKQYLRSGETKSCGCLKKESQNLAEKNGMWRGDKVGYVPLHIWVKKRKPKPKYCECCKLKPPLDLANKGLYNRELKNWEWLCRSCHMKKDGRINNLKQFNTD